MTLASLSFLDILFCFPFPFYFSLAYLFLKWDFPSKLIYTLHLSLDFLFSHETRNNYFFIEVIYISLFLFFKDFSHIFWILLRNFFTCESFPLIITLVSYFSSALKHCKKWRGDKKDCISGAGALTVLEKWANILNIEKITWFVNKKLSLKGS